MEEYARSSERKNAVSAAAPTVPLNREGDVEEDASLLDSKRSAICASVEALLRTAATSETPLVSRRRPCLNILPLLSKPRSEAEALSFKVKYRNML